MSWEAVQWANRQRLRLPQEQLVLLILANCADPDGVAFSAWRGKDHWWRYLMDRTRMSRSAVFRHLATIEKIGLGVRTDLLLADGTKRPTVHLDLTKVFDAELEEGNSPFEPDEDDAEEGANPVPPVGLGPAYEPEASPTGGTESVPPVGLHIDSNIGSNLSSPDPLHETQPPQPSGEGIDEAERQKRREEFRQVYPIVTNRPGLVDALLGILTTEDFERAMAGARGAKALRDANPKRPPPLLAPEKYLRDAALWAEYARHAPAKPKAPPVRRFVAHGTAEWDARAVLAEIAGLDMPAASERFDAAGLALGCGADFGPLPDGALALAQFADLPIGQWLIVEKGSHEFAAWAGRLNALLGRWIEPRALDELNADGTRVTIRKTVGARVFEAWPVRRQGLRVPQAFPPPKTGPPDAAAEDAREGNDGEFSEE